jgi:hypothetical protein
LLGSHIATLSKIQPDALTAVDSKNSLHVPLFPSLPTEIRLLRHSDQLATSFRTTAQATTVLQLLHAGFFSSLFASKEKHNNEIQP